MIKYSKPNIIHFNAELWDTARLYQEDGCFTDIHTYIVRCKDAVLDAFSEEDIYINDLFYRMYDKKEQYLREDMIHPNEEGVKLLGNAVAETIRKCPFLKLSMLKMK